MNPSRIPPPSIAALPLILIVEDDPFDVWLLQNSLAAVGADHPVVVCADGQEALAWLRRASEEPAARLVPALMLLDLQLPLLDGMTLLRWTRSQRALRAMSIAVVSGSLDPEAASRAFAAGADQFLAKPVDAGTVRELLEAAGLLPEAVAPEREG
jgi:CheY-like chemotaxis protein